MMKASDIGKNSIIEFDGAPHAVDSMQVQTPSARGGSSIYKIRFRNMRTGQKVDKALRGEESVQETEVETRRVQFLYQSGDDYTFMDTSDYSQFDLKKNEIEEAIPYLVEDLEDITALLYEDRIITIRPPDTVDLEIVECDPSIKGATAAARTKPATLSTGLVVQVPEYISQGEMIRVETRKGEFVSRV
ncbi:MAG: elongation factor P-like protein YeiP [Verrucomicrobiota bacterium]